MKKANKNIKRGFTLIEVLVAVSIVSLAVSAIFASVQSSLQRNNLSENRITAYYLAVEAIEFIRNKRDENGIKNIQGYGTGSSVNWLKDIYESPSDPCNGRTCTIDSPANSISSCSSSSTCPNLNYNTISGLYSHSSSGSGWIGSPFRRSVNITSISPTEVSVTVSVYWSEQNISKTYNLTEIIRNWQ